VQSAATAVLLLSFAWSIYVAAEFWRRDARDPFSASKALAGWLVEQRLTGLPIAAWPSAHCESILPYLPGVRFYDPGIRRYGTYMRWDRATVAGFELPEPEVVRRVVEAFPRQDALLIANQPMRSAEAAGFRLVHAEIGPVMMGDEQYFVYRRP
jgi:hypothetical protein